MHQRSSRGRSAAVVGRVLALAACVMPGAVASLLTPGRAPAAGLAVVRTEHGARVTVADEPFAEIVVDAANKPYVWPIHGPQGLEMTRGYPLVDLPDEPQRQRDHPHHRGLTFGHESCGGDTWHDRSTYESLLAKDATAEKGREALARLGAIRHREFTLLEADGERAIVESLCDHVDPQGQPRLTERRRLTFRAAATVRTLDVDQLLTALAEPVAVGDNKDAGLLIRVPVSLAVDSRQGGRIVSSEGRENAHAWAQPARWCDYQGPIAGRLMGIAILNHPESFRHPTRWHVRTYGLFAANPFASRAFDPGLPDAATTLAPAASIRLHHRFVFHEGDDREAAIDEAWTRYAAERPPWTDGR